MRRLRSILFVFAALGAFALSASPVFAYDESTATVPPFSEANCSGCHMPYPAAVFSGTGPHGAYSTTTDKCEACHTVHVAPSNGVQLLEGPTYSAMCMTCHDGTQGRGVYGTIAARGLTVTANHSFEATSVIPGGDGATGGSATADFLGVDDALTCVDCHNPHGSQVVAPFQADRNRVMSFGAPLTTNKLLRQKPTSSATTATVYGSDWCATCHDGRLSGGAVHNHPVDSTLTTTTPFTFANVALTASDAPTATTVMGKLSLSNRGFVMRMPRTAQQAGHSPICQQCHNDPRFAGELSADGLTADAATYTVNTASIDGSIATDNPRFQTFPHETTGTAMLLEQNDDLCTNCHPPLVLP